MIFALLGVAFFAILVASLFVRRHGESTTARPEWTPTEERFRDPSTGRLMRVWLDHTGARHYVPD